MAIASNFLWFMCVECVKKGLACATVAQRIRRGANLWPWLINLAEESDTN